jgi:hypothetical protein
MAGFVANGSIVLRYAAPATAIINIRLYDLRGRCMRSLVNGSVFEGVHYCRIDKKALNVSGIYLVKMNTTESSPAFEKTLILQFPCFSRSLAPVVSKFDKTPRN